jgi:hypothetical protein
MTQRSAANGRRAGSRARQRRGVHRSPDPEVIEASALWSHNRAARRHLQGHNAPAVQHDEAVTVPGTNHSGSFRGSRDGVLDDVVHIGRLGLLVDDVDRSPAINGPAAQSAPYPVTVDAVSGRYHESPNRTNSVICGRTTQAGGQPRLSAARPSRCPTASSAPSARGAGAADVTALSGSLRRLRSASQQPVVLLSMLSAAGHPGPLPGSTGR